MTHSTEKPWNKISFVDANIFINAFTDLQPEKKKPCEILLKNIETGKENCATNYLVLLEACHRIALRASKSFARTLFRRFLSFQNLTLVPLGNTLFFEALKRYGTDDLSLNDLIHYKTAQSIGAAQIYSYDKDFDELDIPRVEP